MAISMILQNKKQLSKIVGFVALLLSGPAFIATSDPRNLPLPLLVVPFAWLFVTLFFAITWIAQRRPFALTRRRAGLAAGVGATLPVLLLVFQSIHQLSLKDILISVGIISVASFYLYRADFLR